MYKMKRLAISPYMVRGLRSLLLGLFVCFALWSAVMWRHLAAVTFDDLLPPAAERELSHLRRSRRLQEYIDDATPLITPQHGLCATLESVPVVALVSSSPGNTEHRSAIRATWATEILTYFFIGRSSNAKLHLDEDMVSNYIEAKEHSDLIVGDYLDSYENLTLKTASMLRWAERNCPHAQFVFKTDDDVMVNPWRLRDVVRENIGGHLVGYKINSSIPHRDKENKWYLPRWLYRPDLIPEYLSGTGYLVNGEHLSKINEASNKVPLINLEDVFLTYLVANRNLGLILSHDSRLSPYQPMFPSGCAFWNFASVHSLKPRQMLNIWPKIRALGEQYKDGNNPCNVFNKFFGFLSWEILLT